MPANARGLQSHLDYWLYGIVKVSDTLGSTRSFLRGVQEETIRKLLSTEALTFPPGAEPVEILRTYNRHLDDRGILDADDIAYHQRGRSLAVSVGESCPYRSTCNWLHADRVPLPCFRAIAMGELLRIVSHHAFEGRLTRFGVPCHLTFTRIALEETPDGD